VRLLTEAIHAAPESTASAASAPRDLSPVLRVSLIGPALAIAGDRGLDTLETKLDAPTS